MRRREFIGLVGGALAACPLATRAQQPTKPIVGFLGSTSADSYKSAVASVRQGLQETGYVEGRNVTIEYRWADGKYDRLPAFAAELVDRRVAVIVANTAAALVAKTATSTIPIVFTSGVDPVKAGLVASLNRPGGNVTGISTMSGSLVAKQLELLHEAAPGATVIALLVNPTNPTLSEALSTELQTATRTLGLRLHVINASSEREIDAAFETMKTLQAGALIIGADGLLNTQSEHLAALTIRYAMPASSPYGPFVEAGGLMRYGNVSTDNFRLVGVYAGRILKGERPADLPIQQIAKVELIINLKTAKTLGLTIPLPLLGRADRVIE